MSDENRADGECCGVDFYVDVYWRFVVPDLDKLFKSYDEMKAAIEAAEKRIKAAKKVKLVLSVIGDDQKQYVITGVNAGHGGLITNWKQQRYERAPQLYVDVEWIRDAIRELANTRQRADDIENVLKKYEIHESQGGKSWRGKGQGDGTPEGLQKVYDALVKQAKKTALAKEILELKDAE